jgi:predicted amidohydrolase
MAIRLFHFTSGEAAQEIVDTGFRGPSVWLSPDLESIIGEAVRSALIVVELNLSIVKDGRVPDRD